PPHVLRPVHPRLDPGAHLAAALAPLVPGARELLLREPRRAVDLPAALGRLDVPALLPQAAVEGVQPLQPRDRARQDAAAGKPDRVPPGGNAQQGRRSVPTAPRA